MLNEFTRNMVLLFAIGLIGSGCRTAPPVETVGIDPDAYPWIPVESFPFASSREDLRSRNFDFSGSSRMVVVGIGSGMYGLDIYEIRDSRVIVQLNENLEDSVLYEIPSTTLKAEIDAIIAANDTTNGPRSYTADAWDGTQSILWILDDHGSKVVYFDNHFPDWYLEILGLLRDARPYAVRGTKPPLAGQAALWGLMADYPADGPDTERIDINLADVEAPAQLPGIGDVMAKRIVAYRTEHGPFLAIDDLLKVNGIGLKTLTKFRSQVYINHHDDRHVD